MHFLFWFVYTFTSNSRTGFNCFCRYIYLAALANRVFNLNHHWPDLINFRLGRMTIDIDVCMYVETQLCLCN